MPASGAPLTAPFEFTNGCVGNVQFHSGTLVFYTNGLHIELRDDAGNCASPVFIEFDDVHQVGIGKGCSGFRIDVALKPLSALLTASNGFDTQEMETNGETVVRMTVPLQPEDAARFRQEVKPWLKREHEARASTTAGMSVATERIVSTSMAAQQRMSMMPDRAVTPPPLVTGGVSPVAPPTARDVKRRTAATELVSPPAPSSGAPRAVAMTADDVLAQDASQDATQFRLPRGNARSRASTSTTSTAAKAAQRADDPPFPLAERTKAPARAPRGKKGGKAPPPPPRHDAALASSDDDGTAGGLLARAIRQRQAPTAAPRGRTAGTKRGRGIHSVLPSRDDDDHNEDDNAEDVAAPLVQPKPLQPVRTVAASPLQSMPRAVPYDAAAGRASTRSPLQLRDTVPGVSPIAPVAGPRSPYDPAAAFACAPPLARGADADNFAAADVTCDLSAVNADSPVQKPKPPRSRATRTSKADTSAAAERATAAASTRRGVSSVAHRAAPPRSTASRFLCDVETPPTRRSAADSVAPEVDTMRRLLDGDLSGDGLMDFMRCATGLVKGRAEEARRSEELAKSLRVSEALVRECFDTTRERRARDAEVLLQRMKGFEGAVAGLAKTQRAVAGQLRAATATLEAEQEQVAAAAVDLSAAIEDSFRAADDEDSECKDVALATLRRKLGAA